MSSKKKYKTCANWKKTIEKVESNNKTTNPKELLRNVVKGTLHTNDSSVMIRSTCPHIVSNL